MLSFSRIHMELGLLVALTMVVCSFATIVLLPALIMEVRSDFLVKSSSVSI